MLMESFCILYPAWQLFKACGAADHILFAAQLDVLRPQEDIHIGTVNKNCIWLHKLNVNASGRRQ